MNEQKIISKYMAKISKKGHRKLTPERRSDRARGAVNARWDKYRLKRGVDKSLAITSR